MFIAGLIFLPIILFVLTFSMIFYYSMKFFFKLLRRTRFLNSILGFIIISPIFITYFILIVGIGATLGAIATGIGILPALSLHVYLFIRTIYWWRRTRVKKMKADTALS